MTGWLVHHHFFQKKTHTVQSTLCLIIKMFDIYNTTHNFESFIIYKITIY